MKKLLLLSIGMAFLFRTANAQDSLNVKIDFQTTPQTTVPVYKVVYLADYTLDGYIQSVGNADGKGKIFKREFLFNAPNTGTFNGNAPIKLIMTDNDSYSETINIDPRLGYQKWHLQPAGKFYKSSLYTLGVSLIGIVASSIWLGMNKAENDSRMEMYNAQLKSYELMNSSSNWPGSFPAPVKPTLRSNAAPTILLSCSISTAAIGSWLFAKNRPIAKRIE